MGNTTSTNNSLAYTEPFTSVCSNTLTSKEFYWNNILIVITFFICHFKSKIKAEILIFFYYITNFYDDLSLYLHKVLRTFCYYYFLTHTFSCKTKTKFDFKTRPTHALQWLAFKLRFWQYMDLCLFTFWNTLTNLLIHHFESRHWIWIWLQSLNSFHE